MIAGFAGGSDPSWISNSMFHLSRICVSSQGLVPVGERPTSIRIASRSWRAVAEAPDRMRPSYEAAAKGMTVYIANLNPSGVSRRQRNVVVVDADGYEIVSLRVHLFFDVVGERVGAFMYFSEKHLTPPELAIMETAVAMAVRQLDASAAPAIVFVRSGVQHAVDPAAALTDTRVRFLRAESLAYRQEWAVAD